MAFDKCRYYSIIDSLPNACAYWEVIVDANDSPVDYMFLEINRAFEHLIGLNRERVIGKKVSELMSTKINIRFDWLWSWTEKRLHNESYLMELYFDTLGYWYQITCFCDQPGYVGAIFQDITKYKLEEEAVAKQKQTEENLRSSEEKFRAISMAALDAVIMMNDKGQVVYWNPAAERIFGYTAKEMMGKYIHNIIMPDYYRTKHEKGFKLFKNTGQGSAIGKVVELTAKHKSGPEFPIEIALSHIKIDNDYWASAIIRDITERKEAEEEVRRNEARLQSLVELLQYEFTNVKEFLVYVLEQALKLTESKLGYIFKYDEGSKIFVLNSWSEGTMNECRSIDEKSEVQLATTGLWGEAVRQRKPIVVNDYQAPNPYKKGYSKGHAAISRFMTLPIFHNNEIIAVIGVANKQLDYSHTDLLQLTLLMDAVTKIIDHKNAVEERLQSEIKAREEAEKANKLKSQFLANMSHEIRTPMNVIYGMTDLLYHASLEAEHKEYVKMVKDSALSLLAIINDILDFSKIEAGKLELEQVDFSLYQTVEKAVSILALKAHEKKLKLTSIIHKDVPEFLHGDSIRLQQVLVNILNNGIKFTDQGEVILELKKVNSSENINIVTLEFSVMDTGIGIPEDKLDLLFKSFSQIDGSHSRKYEGTGLGLAISKKLVELMDGSIQVQSKEGHGSIFTFTIPFKISASGINALGGDVFASPQVKNINSISSNKEQLLSSTKKLHILLVEDKPMNQKLASVLLEKKGWKVTTVNNGEEAVKLVDNNDFDLILMDVQMPVMDGVQATQLIRTKEAKAGKHTPIIALTANAMKGDREKYLRIGMDGYISKPIHSEELYRAIETIAKLPAINKASLPEKIFNNLNLIEGNATAALSLHEELLEVTADVRQILAQLHEDKELLAEIVPILFRDVDKDLEKIAELLAAKDIKAITWVAHGLKGELGNMGMKKAYQIAAKLQYAVRESQLTEAAKYANDLKVEVERYKAFFARTDWQKLI